MDTIDGVIWVSLGSVFGGMAQILAVRICRAARRRDISLGNDGHQCERRVLYRRACGIGCRPRGICGRQAVAICRHRILGMLHHRVLLQPADLVARPRRRAQARGLESAALAVALSPRRRRRLCRRPARFRVRRGPGHAGQGFTQDFILGGQTGRQPPPPRARRSLWWPKLRDAAGSYVAVALGSIVGGVARYLVSVLFLSQLGGGFPWATLFVNVTGSFIIGFYATLTGPDGRLFVSPRQRQFVMVGICGGSPRFPRSVWRPCGWCSPATSGPPPSI